MSVFVFAITSVSCGGVKTTAEAKVIEGKDKAIFGDGSNQLWEVTSETYKLQSPAPTIGEYINLNSEYCPYPFYLTEQTDAGLDIIGSIGGYFFDTALNALKSGEPFYEDENMFMIANTETSEVICYVNYKGNTQNVVLVYSFPILSADHWMEYRTGVTGAIIPEIKELIDSVKINQQS